MSAARKRVRHITATDLTVCARQPAGSNDMDYPKCVVCGAEVEGTVEDVPLTLCCKGCCKDSCEVYSRVYKGYARVSKTRALMTYHCAEADLDILKHVTLPNPIEPDGPSMKLFLKKEVEYLGRKRREICRAEADQRERGGIIGKIIGLKAVSGIDLAKMDGVLRHFVLGDFLDKPHGTKTTMADVDARIGVLDRVNEILNACQQAHPQAVFDFCLAYPEGGPAEFQELKEKARAVFHLEGARILHKLSSRDVSRLKDTSLHDVYEEFVNRDSNAIIRGHLLKWFRAETADEIMHHPAVLRRLVNRGEELDVAEKLREFWLEKDDREKRTERLKAALQAKGRSLLVNCPYCEEYVNGEVDCDVIEVVGIVEAYEKLNEIRTLHPYRRFLLLESKFREAYYEMKQSYEESVAAAVQSAISLPCLAFLADSDSDISDYSIDDGLFSDIYVMGDHDAVFGDLGDGWFSESLDEDDFF